MTEQAFSTGLSKITNSFAPMIEQQLSGNGINMDGYAKQCVVSAISAINNVLDAKGIGWNDPSLDRNNITQILLSVASLKLNAAASPREVYFQTRNVKVTKPDKTEEWKKQIEMGIEGDGNDSILARFGRDIKKVGQFWLVREHDHFEYPKFTGLSYEPPIWQPTGKGDVIRVVYPVLKNDDSIEFYISERDDVTKNLIAHMNNNLMNETFGICKDRYSANSEQKKQIAAKKSEILKKAKDLGMAALDDPDLQQYISPAWTDYHSRESMIIRKMRNNVVKKIPKDFGNAFVEMIHSEATDLEYAEVRREIQENGNGEVIDIKPDSEPPKQETTPTKPEQPPEQTRKEPAQSDNPAASQSAMNLDGFNPDVQEPAATTAGGPGF